MDEDMLYEHQYQPEIQPTGPIQTGVRKHTPAKRAHYQMDYEYIT